MTGSLWLVYLPITFTPIRSSFCPFVLVLKKIISVLIRLIYLWICKYYSSFLQMKTPHSSLLRRDYRSLIVHYSGGVSNIDDIIDDPVFDKSTKRCVISQKSVSQLLQQFLLAISSHPSRWCLMASQYATFSTSGNILSTKILNNA